MEKIYMETPRRNTNTWRKDDISPYDFRDDVTQVKQENFNQSSNQTNENRMNQNRYMSEEDEYDMDAIMDEMNQLEDIEYDCHPELDMYDNGNIDWRWNEDVSLNPKNMTIDRKTIVEEENPKRKTTTWMRVKREY